MDFDSLAKFLKRQVSKRQITQEKSDLYLALLKREYLKEIPNILMQHAADYYNLYDEISSDFLKDYFSNLTDYEIFTSYASRRVGSSRGTLASSFSEFCVNTALKQPEANCGQTALIPDRANRDVIALTDLIADLYYALGTLHAWRAKLRGESEAGLSIETPTKYASPRASMEIQPPHPSKLTTLLSSSLNEKGPGKPLNGFTSLPSVPKGKLNGAWSLPAKNKLGESYSLSRLATLNSASKHEVYINSETECYLDSYMIVARQCQQHLTDLIFKLTSVDLYPALKQDLEKHLTNLRRHIEQLDAHNNSQPAVTSLNASY